MCDRVHYTKDMTTAVLASLYYLTPTCSAICNCKRIFMQTFSCNRHLHSIYNQHCIHTWLVSTQVIRAIYNQNCVYTFMVSIHMQAHIKPVDDMREDIFKLKEDISSLKQEMENLVQALTSRMEEAGFNH